MINKASKLETLKYGIAGLGLIGGSLAKAIRLNLPGAVIHAYDKPQVLKAAALEGTIDLACRSLDELLVCDIIFLAMPAELNLINLEYLAPKLNVGTIITDVSGVKKPFDELWSRLTSKGTFIGGHPMAGKETGGYANSEPQLFENAVYILTDKHPSCLLEDMLDALGAKVIYMSSAEHDKNAAFISHLPQLAAVSLVNALPAEHYINMAAGGFRDLTRIASSSYEVWKPVLELNAGEITAAVDILIERLMELKQAVLTGDFDKLKESFNSADSLRKKLPGSAKVYRPQLHSLKIDMNDQPDGLLNVLTCLLNGDVDTTDIEIIKVDDSAANALQINFSSERAKARAIKTLQSAGFIINRNF